MLASLRYYKSDFRQNWKLSLPIMAGQLGQTLVNLADNIMVGKLGATSLAAVSFANALFALFFVVGMGISFALPPLVSQADGAGEHRVISQYFKHSLLINIIFSLLSAIALTSGLPLLDYMGQEPAVVAEAKKYLVFVAWSMVPYMIFQTLRSYSDGMSETTLPMVIIIMGNVLNVLLNYMLIFGNWEAPAMGVEGASLGSLIARSVMVVGLILVLMPREKLWSHIRNARYNIYQSALIKKLLSLGIPTSLQMLFEVSAFSGAAIITGLISESAQAAHQIAINLASVTFMICTGLAMAATIRVGNQLGIGDRQKLRDAGMSAFIQVALIMSIFALGFVLFRKYLPYIYLDDPQVVGIASVLLICAAIFQIPDGLQVTAQSALRGMQDVKVPTLITFVSYWVIGLPISYVTSIVLDWGPIGVWVGLIFGLSVSAILLTRRFDSMSRDFVEI